MRTGRLAKLMSERGFDGALVSPGSNFYHLTGLRIHETGERPTILALTPTASTSSSR